MSTANAMKVYLALLLALAMEVSIAVFWPRHDSLIMLAAGGQFLLLLVFYLGLYRHRGWVRMFGWLWLIWLLVMMVFILGEAMTR
jgi:uncharacterized membrane protein